MHEESLSVLLVEDSPGDARLLRETLRDEPGADYEITVATSLADALERLAEQRFDAVLLDLSLPDSHGIETFLTLHQQWPDVATVVLTGLDDESLAIRAVQEGSQDYLVKGEVTGGTLVRSIRYAIERQRTSHYLAVMVERERFDTAVSQMSDGIVVTDDELRVTTANRAAQLLLNLPEGEPSAPALADALAPFKLSSPLPELLASHDRVTAFEIAREHTRPPLYLDARLTRLFDTRGQLVSAVLMLRDVTDERRERQAQVDFFNLVSHKLRTPLTVLTGYMDVLRGLSPERWGSEAHRILMVCRDEVGRLNETLLKMLQFKRQTGERPAAGTQISHLGPLLEEVAEEIRERYRNREVELQVASDPDLAPLDIHPEQLRFALDQILDNAVKFGDKEPIRVAASARGLDSAVEVVVTDNGPGIPHEYRDRVFEGFVQIEDFGTGEVPGLGVGLRLARQVVTANGGSVALHSVIGHGTAVTLRLPALPG